jgi:hypothetical protein
VNSSAQNRSELDGVVLGIELTLCSIIQGVALYFLIENARLTLSKGRPESWPYIAAGLLIILLFWSRSLIHTLTLIRWPLEFVHNFFYVACTFVEAIAFTRLNDPFRWFQLTAIFAVLVWALFLYDLRIIKLRGEDSAGPVGCRLYEIVESDQNLNIRLIIPAIFVFNLGCALAIWHWPDYCLARHGHFIFISIQVAGLIIYLVHVIRSFSKMSPLISATREEWRMEAAKTSV